MAMSMEYAGGSKTAAGSNHIELKSRVAPPTLYTMRGVEAIEIVPQHARTRKTTTSWARQGVSAIPAPSVTAASAIRDTT
jgi:hypothetical protein